MNRNRRDDSAAEQYLARLGLCRITADPHIIGTLKNDTVENK
jgi:hypothetical protein